LSLVSVDRSKSAHKKSICINRTGRTTNSLPSQMFDG
jgi:hypothetical protein